MQDLFTFYTTQIKKHETALEKVGRQLLVSSMLRLAVFLLGILGIYVFIGSAKWVLLLILIAGILFLFLVSRHANLNYSSKKLKALIAINERELNVLDHEFHHLPEGSEFKDTSHHFSQDIDLFGRGSFYQYCNRTVLSQGSVVLADLLTENNIEQINSKQEAIKELAQMPEWRQEFLATAKLAKTQMPTGKILKWLQNYVPFVPKVMHFVPGLFSTVSLGILTLYFLDRIQESFMVYWLFLGLGITSLFSRKVMRLSQHATQVQSTFQQYNQLLKLIEETQFKSAILSRKRQQIISEGQKTSRILKKFSRTLNSLDKNNNFIYLFIANGFFLRTFTHCRSLEYWIQKYGGEVEQWFDTIAFFDAYISLGTFAFNHPDYAFPKLTTGNTILKSKNAGHPLLPPDKCVLNDFQIAQGQFFIITGANMAGKSTFLRTISLQLVMANMGLPVYAEEVEYAPIKLITSMRTTDSLTDDESYFFSELKRLKYIVDQIDRDRYFIVLDEILKGTNSTDKARGSKKFVERLVASKSTGIIATHDLSLCELASDFPQVRNYYFDAEIKDNELHFDYKFKTGICQNMNASFLLRKMKIVD